MSTVRNPAPVLPLLLGGALLCGCPPAIAQSACTSDGYRVLAQRWDVVLARGWELRQNCAHPEWPARAVAVHAAGLSVRSSIPPRTLEAVSPAQLVHAGEPVRLWLQDAAVRIEMSGVAEQSGRNGDHVIVRIIRQTDEDGTTIERFTGIVRGAGDVEMQP